VVYFVLGWNAVPGHFVTVNDVVSQAIHAAFAAAGISFTYPTRNVIVRR